MKISPLFVRSGQMSCLFPLDLLSSVLHHLTQQWWEIVLKWCHSIKLLIMSN